MDLLRSLKLKSTGIYTTDKKKYNTDPLHDRGSGKAETMGSITEIKKQIKQLEKKQAENKQNDRYISIKIQNLQAEIELIKEAEKDRKFLVSSIVNNIKETKELRQNNNGAFKTDKQVKELTKYIFNYNGFNDYEILLNDLDLEHIFITFSIIFNTGFSENDKSILETIIKNQM